MLLGDLLSPTKQGGLLPNMAISFPADFRREIAFKNFLVFRDIPDYEVPFDMHSYFQLRWTDEGIRSGNSESIDSTVARQVTDPSSGLDNLACFFWDTPLSDIVSGINAVKGVFDHSLIASPNSKSTLYLVNAKLADFKAVFSHLGTFEGPRFSAAPAMERVKAIEMLWTIGATSLHPRVQARVRQVLVVESVPAAMPQRVSMLHRTWLKWNLFQSMKKVRKPCLHLLFKHALLSLHGP